MSDAVKKTAEKVVKANKAVKAVKGDKSEKKDKGDKKEVGECYVYYSAWQRCVLLNRGPRTEMGGWWGLCDTYRHAFTMCVS